MKTPQRHDLRRGAQFGVMRWRSRLCCFSERVAVVKLVCDAVQQPVSSLLGMGRSRENRPVIVAKDRQPVTDVVGVTNGRNDVVGGTEKAAGDLGDKLFSRVCL